MGYPGTFNYSVPNVARGVIRPLVTGCPVRCVYLVFPDSVGFNVGADIDSSGHSGIITECRDMAYAIGGKGGAFTTGSTGGLVVLGPVHVKVSVPTSL
jgi:hypothetical protein